MNNPKIAIFASGRGSNAVKIYEHGQRTGDYIISLIVTNRKNAGILDFATEKGLPTLIIDRHTFYETTGAIDELQGMGINFIVLAGFLWLVPPDLIAAYPRKIVNIHPAILPKYGGKGMYGHHVHEAVMEAGETESGLTIHWVNEEYDDGGIILQSKCKIKALAADEIAKKVLRLEHHFYPKVISGLTKNL